MDGTTRAEIAESWAEGRPCWQCGVWIHAPGHVCDPADVATARRLGQALIDRERSEQEARERFQAMPREW